jgi:hypothetical protein
MRLSKSIESIRTRGGLTVGTALKRMTTRAGDISCCDLAGYFDTSVLPCPVLTVVDGGKGNRSGPAIAIVDGAPRAHVMREVLDVADGHATPGAGNDVA